MKQDNESNNESISALVDGRLQGEDFAQTMAAMASQPDDVATWHLYHLIGDVLRSEDLAVGSHSGDFLARLESELAWEPAPAALKVPVPVDSARPSANADVLRWKWVAGLAASALVSVVGLSLWNQPANTTLQATAAPADTQILLRDPQLDALMAAHQQLGGHSALQMPSGFLRNATFERPAQ